MMQTIRLYTENKIGILEKVTTVFTRNRLNIQQLSLKENAHDSLSSITIRLEGDADQVRKVLPQLRKIVEVADVSILL